MITELVINTNYDSERIPLLHKQEIRGFPLGSLVVCAHNISVEWYAGGAVSFAEA